MARIQKITIGKTEYIEHAGFVRYRLSTATDGRRVLVTIEIGRRPQSDKPISLAQTLEFALRSTSRLHDILNVLGGPSGTWKSVTYLFADSQLAGIMNRELHVLWLHGDEPNVISSGP